MLVVRMEEAQEALVILLASGSPRRREFLRALSLPFEARTASVDETPLPGEAPPETASRLSRAKAEAVAGDAPGRWVVGADTVVVLEGEALGKPRDPSDAACMLRRLAGRSHSVYSAVTVLAPDGRSATELACARVTMRAYTDAEIQRYVATGDPMDKAGAYAIQNPEFAPVAHIGGCYANVMGLPLCHLARALQLLGYPLRVDVPAVCRSHTGFDCTYYSELAGT